MLRPGASRRLGKVSKRVRIPPYGATRLLGDARFSPIVLRARYAGSGTDAGDAATRGRGDRGSHVQHLQSILRSSTDSGYAATARGGNRLLLAVRPPEAQRIPPGETPLPEENSAAQRNSSPRDTAFVAKLYCVFLVLDIPVLYWTFRWCPGRYAIRGTEKVYGPTSAQRAACAR
eukprot:1477059-Rhodomonas_salina.5